MSRAVARIRTSLLTTATAVTAALALAAPAVAAPAPLATGPAAGTSASAAATTGNPTQSAIDALVNTGGMPGVAAQTVDTSKGYPRTWFGSAGVADTSTGRARTPQDHLRAGSITKTFVTVVLLQMEAEGKLSLDDTVERWLPGVVQGNGNDGSKVTVRQLLNHTSGIRDMVYTPEWHEYMNGPGFLAHRFETRTPQQIVDMALKYQPDFAPGTGWNYSNTNFVLAGMIIQKVGGKSYAVEAERRIVKRLGLTGTTFPGTSPKMPLPHAVGYSKLYASNPGPEVYDATEYNPAWSGATGEIISTTRDLNTFYSALIKGRLLPAAQQSELLTTVKTGTFFDYGLGLIVRPLSCGVKVYGHDGIVWGSLTSTATTADGKRTLTFHINGDWLEDQHLGLYQDVFEAEFCGKK